MQNASPCSTRPLPCFLQHPRSRSPTCNGCACVRAVRRSLVTREGPASVKTGPAPMLSIVPEADKRWIVGHSLCLDMPMGRIAFRQRIMRGRSAWWKVTEGPLRTHCSLFDSSWGAAIRRDDCCLHDRHRTHLLRSRSAGRPPRVYEDLGPCPVRKHGGMSTHTSMSSPHRVDLL